MSGLEGIGLGYGVKASAAIVRNAFADDELDRLWTILANRFASEVPLAAADYALWLDDPAFAEPLAKFVAPPYDFDRAALIDGVTPLVGKTSVNQTASAFAARVVDALRDAVTMAKSGDDLTRFGFDQLGKLIRTRSSLQQLDASWAPPRARYSLERLTTNDPAGAEQLHLALKGRELAIELDSLVKTRPAWLRDAGVFVWESVARLAEVAGACDAAMAAWTESGEKAGSDRARALLLAAAAAAVAGHVDKEEQLRRAADEYPQHPLVILTNHREEPAQARLDQLVRLQTGGDAELTAIVAGHKAMALLDLDRYDEAEAAANEATKIAPWVLIAREAAADVVLARNEALQAAGQRVNRRDLLLAAEQLQLLRDDQRASRRFRESGLLLRDLARCLLLADRPDLARTALGTCLAEELDFEDVATKLAGLAFNAGEVDVAEHFLASCPPDHAAAELMRAHLGLRHSESRADAVSILDRRVVEGDRDAASLRLTASLPGSDELAWSEAAEKLLRSTDPALASYLKAAWHDRHGEHQAALRELGAHAGDHRVLGELMQRFAASGNWQRAATAARALLRGDPKPEIKIAAAEVLVRADAPGEGEAVLRAVLDDSAGLKDEIEEAFGELSVLLLTQGRMDEADKIARAWPEHGGLWVSAYVAARRGQVVAARAMIEGLSPRSYGDTMLAIDLHWIVDAPSEAYPTLVKLADSLEEPDEQAEFRVTATLLRLPGDMVSADMIERAGPEQFARQFPESPLLHKRTFADDEDGLEVLRDAAQRQLETINAARERVLFDRTGVVGEIAGAAGMSLAGAWSTLSVLPLGDVASPPSAEVDRAMCALGGPAIVETGALYTLQMLSADVSQVILRELPLSVVSQATLEDLLVATTPTLPVDPGEARRFRWDQGERSYTVARLGGRHDAEDRATVESMQQLAWALHTAPATASAAGSDERPGTVGALVSSTYTDITELARRTRHPVYTDDARFREILAEAGLETFGTPALIAALKQSDALNEELCVRAIDELHRRTPS